jgi:hypothetical protein
MPYSTKVDELRAIIFPLVSVSYRCFLSQATPYPLSFLAVLEQLNSCCMYSTHQNFVRKSFFSENMVEHVFH